MGAMVGLGLFALISPITAAYSLTGTRTGMLLRETLTVMCCYLPLSCYNSMNIEGLFRSGGDIKFVLLMDTGGIWMVGMPLTLLLGDVLKLPLLWVFMAYVCVEIYKLLIGFSDTGRESGCIPCPCNRRKRKC